MPALHQIGKKHFFHTMKYPSTQFPLMESGHTQEIEDPYRAGDAWVVRVPFTRTAVVVGRWVCALKEDDALASAIQMRELDVA
jgi:hypothetical protein